MESFAGIVFDPLVPLFLLLPLAFVAALVTGFALWRRASGAFWRTAALALALLVLANPSVVQEDRSVLPDVAVAVIDDSPSMGIGDRRHQAAEAEAVLREKFAHLPNTELRVVHAGNTAAKLGPSDDGTLLFEALDHAFADTPRERVAGSILVTDGEVHDVPPPEVAAKFGGPIHALIVGNHGEIDRRLIVEQAPRYGIVGNPQSLTIRVEEAGADGSEVPVTLRVQGSPSRTLMVPIGESRNVPFTLQHGGPTFIEIEVEPGPHELTLQNNRAAVMVNGVRDRLRVLLVTGDRKSVV